MAVPGREKEPLKQRLLFGWETRCAAHVLNCRGELAIVVQ